MTSAAELRAAADRKATTLSEVIARIGTSRPLREIVSELVRLEVPTERGGQWHPTTVARLLRRLGHVPGMELAHGRGRDLPLRSVNLLLTSPPYANQRRRQYGGVSELDYPAWTVRWLNEWRPFIAEDGNIALVIRPHVVNGQISDYVLRTRLAVREAGFREIEELVWLKPNSPPLGNVHRPRRAWESILWFSMSPRPFCDPKANGRKSDRVGFVVKKGLGDYMHGASEARTGIARCRDFIAVGTASSDRDPQNLHPAQFPQALAEWIIRLLCPPGGVVADPFLGSGASSAAALATGRRFVGSDINQGFVDIARKRLRRVDARRN